MERLSETIENIASAPTTGDAVGVPTGNEDHWFVAVVNNLSERKCAEALLQDGHEVFVPMRTEEYKGGSGKPRKFEKILLPAKVFVRCTEKERREVVYLPWIKRFLVDRTKSNALGGHPIMVIPDSQIAAFRLALDINPDLQVEDVPFNLGEEVRIVGGRFEGVVGNVFRTPNGRRQVIVALGQLGCFKVAIPARLLKKF